MEEASRWVGDRDHLAGIENFAADSRVKSSPRDQLLVHGVLAGLAAPCRGPSARLGDGEPSPPA